MRTIKEIIADTEKSNLSPTQVGNLLLELMPHHSEMMKTLDEQAHLMAVEVAIHVNAGKSMAVAKAIVDGSELGKAVREAKTNLAFIEEYISSLKYLARAIEKEYGYSNV